MLGLSAQGPPGDGQGQGQIGEGPPLYGHTILIWDSCNGKFIRISMRHFLLANHS